MTDPHTKIKEPTYVPRIMNQPSLFTNLDRGQRTDVHSGCERERLGLTAVKEIPQSFAGFCCMNIFESHLCYSDSCLPYAREDFISVFLVLQAWQAGEWTKRPAGRRSVALAEQASLAVGKAPSCNTLGQWLAEINISRSHYHQGFSLNAGIFPRLVYFVPASNHIWKGEKATRWRKILTCVKEGRL